MGLGSDGFSCRWLGCRLLRVASADEWEWDRLLFGSARLIERATGDPAPTGVANTDIVKETISE